MTQAVGKLNKSHKKKLSPIRKLQITLENEIHDPYPCGVCGRGFRSRHELANHPHDGQARATVRSPYSAPRGLVQ